MPTKGDVHVVPSQGQWKVEIDDGDGRDRDGHGHDPRDIPG